ncbi:hypothetical protein IWGMT90018_02170 [Mycobacterium kiyosense]|nr:hypothetical protein IWGMT90018_02170 [Mycobacterium kiyosense]
MSADHRAAGLGCHRQSAAQHLGHQLQRQQVPRPADQVDRDHRAAAHRIDVRQRVGRGDPAPVVGVVDDGREEVGGGQHGKIANQDGGRVVSVVQPDEHVGAGLTGQAPDRLFEFARRDLAGAAAAVRVAGESPHQPDITATPAGS